MFSRQSAQASFGRCGLLPAITRRAEGGPRPVFGGGGAEALMCVLPGTLCQPCGSGRWRHSGRGSRDESPFEAALVSRHHWQAGQRCNGATGCWRGITRVIRSGSWCAALSHPSGHRSRSLCSPLGRRRVPADAWKKTPCAVWRGLELAWARDLPIWPFLCAMRACACVRDVMRTSCYVRSGAAVAVCECGRSRLCVAVSALAPFQRVSRPGHHITFGSRKQQGHKNNARKYKVNI